MTSTQYGRENYHAWTWGIAALLLLALIWLWITGRGPGAAASCCAATPVVATTAVAPPAVSTPAVPTPVATASATSPATAPAPSVQKPLATLYFAVGKTSAPADTSQLIADVVAYLQNNPSSKAIISGYNDPSGNAAQNAEISKNRAKSAREALKAAGIDEARIEMRKPSDTNLAGDPKQARRVQVSVEP